MCPPRIIVCPKSCHIANRRDGNDGSQSSTGGGPDASGVAQTGAICQPGAADALRWKYRIRPPRPAYRAASKNDDAEQADGGIERHAQPKT